MAHAEKCPICGGNGVLADGPAYLYPTAPTCHGCGGGGWVSVQDEIISIPSVWTPMPSVTTHTISTGDDPNEYIATWGAPTWGAVQT